MNWSGFYKKTINERKALLRSVFPDIKNKDSEYLLREEMAENMIENCVGVATLPLGLALNIRVNNKNYVVPMVVEEPSIVAAVSGIGKLLATNGGFQTSLPMNQVISQIQLLDVENVDLAILSIDTRASEIMELANKSCPSLVRRGGGVVRVETRKIQKSKGNGFWLIVHLHINACEAMGANYATTAAESVAPYLSQLVNARVGFRIVSNLSPGRITTSRFSIPVNKLDYKGVSGLELAHRICEANDWASDDPYRAVTHNKGIMNGIDSVAVATGQDWRAIESACHAWVSLETGKYGPLTKYDIIEKDNELYLCGELSLPLLLGTKGGAIDSNPLYKYSMALMGNPNSQTLSSIMCSIGLAQNFGALRALSTEGIQKGHMKLHSRNIAIAAGAPTHAVTECAEYMVKIGNISAEAANEFLDSKQLKSTKLEPKSMEFISGVTTTSKAMQCFEDSAAVYS